MTLWIDENVATLRRLWDEGKSLSEIARSIPGASRQAVGGKASRLGLERPRKLPATGAKPPSPTPAVRAFAFGPGAHHTPRRATPPNEPAFSPLPGSTPRPLLEMARGLCRWPLIIDGEHFACCLPAADRAGSWRYCEAHEALAIGKVLPPLRDRNPDRARRRAA